MADTFIMRWPTLGKQVVCERIEHNKQIFDWWLDQLPTGSVQSHTIVSGWCLYSVAIPVKTPITWKPGTEVKEDLSKGVDGRFKITIPVGGVVEMLVKYGRRTETVACITFAQVRDEDLPIVREVGAAQWKAVMQTGEVITVEFLKAEEA